MFGDIQCLEIEIATAFLQTMQDMIAAEKSVNFHAAAGQQ